MVSPLIALTLITLSLLYSRDLAGRAVPISVSVQNERVNLNTALAEELMRLPGIGPVLAQRIIAHRRRHGPFKRPEDVIIVRGFSARRFRQIAHLIKV